MASEHMTKPVVAYIAGFTAPEGKQMGMPAPSFPAARAPRRIRKKPLRPLASVSVVLPDRPLKSCERCSLPNRYDDEPEVLAERACRRGSVHDYLRRCLGLLYGLMLLVISMEEGGDNLSAFSVPLTEALVLLSQGIVQD